MKKRVVSALFAASLLLSLAACNSGDSGKAKDTTDTTEVPEVILPAGIEEQNYGKTVNIATYQSDSFTRYFFPNDDMTDMLNKAIYNRQLAVEEYLGVEITYEFTGDWTSLHPTLTVAASTNDDLYQFVFNHCSKDNNWLVTDGLILDMNELDIDFTGEWFNREANEALSVKGKQFFCISDYTLPSPNAVLFNKDLREKHNLEDPYQLVRDGKWTIDKMAEMSSAVTADNGDGVWNIKDTYGFACPDNWYTVSFVYGADVNIISKNENDEFEIVFGDDRTYTMMEKLHALINSPDTYTFNTTNSMYASQVMTIDSGRCLFTLTALHNLHTIRDADVDFGILPYPKLDEAQERYISNDWSGVLCVPMSLSEDSYTMVGDVIELLAYYSTEEVVPAYIDVTLGTKLARDDESREMIGIIFDGCTFDPALNYFGNVEGPAEVIYAVDQTLIRKKQNTLASFLAEYGPMATNAVNDFNEAVKELG